MPNFNIGTLDRTGILYKISTSQGSGGAVVRTTKKYGVVYLRRERALSMSTIVAGGRESTELDDVFIMRFMEELMPYVVPWEVNVEGVQYRIIKSEELGRREGLRIFCRAVV